MIQIALKSDQQRPGFFIIANIQTFPEGGAMGTRGALHSHVWRPPTDVYETSDAVIIRVEIAGMSEDDFMIVLNGQSLSIRGVRVDSTERRAYHQMEIPFGEFISETELHCLVNPKEIEATYGLGFLRITIPKSRPQGIAIDA